MTPHDRFLAHTHESGPCLLWDSDDLRFYADGQNPTMRARPFAWMLATGENEVPKGKVVQAQEGCEPRCVRPEHMMTAAWRRRPDGGPKGTALLVRLSDELWAALGQAAADSDTSKKAVVESALKLYLFAEM